MLIIFTMNQKILAMAVVLTAAALTGLVTTTPLAYADESETETEQELKQENVGSGESTNENCGTNSIDGFLGLTICGEVEIGDDADAVEPTVSETD
jgi:hypothetical protein